MNEQEKSELQKIFQLLTDIQARQIAMESQLNTMQTQLSSTRIGYEVLKDDSGLFWEIVAQHRKRLERLENI
jgi:hypothetical protein